MKKIISLLMVVALLMSFAVVASAAGETQATAYDLGDENLWNIEALADSPFWVTYTATEASKISISNWMSAFTAADINGAPINVDQVEQWGMVSYVLNIEAMAGETVYAQIIPSADDTYNWNIVKHGCSEWPFDAQMGQNSVTGNSWNPTFYQYIPGENGTLTLTIDTATSANGWTYQMGPVNDWGGVGSVDDTDAVWTFDSSTENDDLTSEWYPNGSASTRTINVTAGTTYILNVGNFNEMDSDVVGTVNFTLTFDAGANTDDQYGGQGGQGGAPLDPNAGMDPNNPIPVNFDFNYVTVPAGETRWYLYADSNLPMSGVYSLILNVYGEIDYTVQYSAAPVAPDADGFINAEVYDRTGMGNYLFAITNNSAADTDFYPYFTLVPDYVITNIDLQIGNNTVTLNTEKPNALYQFSNENCGGAGQYTFTVTDKNGNPITDALLGDWGSSGYPVDITGDDKTNSIVWNIGEDAASFLLGVSGVTEDEFVIVIERTGDYQLPGSEEFGEYQNVHTPDAEFEMPEGTLVALDITNPQTVVLGTDGFYHLNTATGPIVFVDMSNDAINLPNAYGAYGANAMRGEYEGVKYEFLNAMKPYANALTEEGYYPLTKDLAAFIQGYGAYQGWFFPMLSPVEAIQSGNANEDSVWLFACSYIEGVNSLVTNNENGGNNTGNGGNNTGNGGNNTGNGVTGTVKPIPPTGDFGIIAAAVALAVSAMGGVALVAKKKEN